MRGGKLLRIAAAIIAGAFPALAIYGALFGRDFLLEMLLYAVWGAVITATCFLIGFSVYMALERLERP